ncbi:MAG: hypothetical protein HOI51_04395 [Nitrosomonadales bacterium]|nr:hypothetical protein [Nitrosomonadales bacterium]
MGLIFRFFLYIFDLLSVAFEALDKRNKDKVLRKKILDIQNFEINKKINEKEMKKIVNDLYKVFYEILDKDHEFYKEMVQEGLKSKNGLLNMFDGLSGKYLNIENSIFNKRALSIFTAGELYTFCFKLGTLSFEMQNKLIIDKGKLDKK